MHVTHDHYKCKKNSDNVLLANYGATVLSLTVVRMYLKDHKKTELRESGVTVASYILKDHTRRTRSVHVSD